MGMGVADLVPGVSGGTIALISGIYNELIESLNQISWTHIKTIPSQGFSFFWKQINGWFLTAVFGGVLMSLALLSHLLEWLIQNEPIALWSFFFGLLVASVFILVRKIKQWSFLLILQLVVGTVLSYSLTQLTGTPTEPSYLHLFFCGFVAISAMILPGLSGAYILLILGVYETILGDVRNVFQVWVDFDIAIFKEVYGRLFVFGVGVLAGLRLFAIFLNWLLKKFPKNSLAVLIGLMVGALHKVWPWQNPIIDNANPEAVLTKAVLPLDYFEEPAIFKALCCLLLGLLILLVLERIKVKKDGASAA